jgi:hypothetical protein
MAVLFYIAYFHFRSYSLNGAATRLTISIQRVNKPINQLPSSVVQVLSTQLANECSTYNKPKNSLPFSQTFDIRPFSKSIENMSTTSHPIFLGQFLISFSRPCRTFQIFLSPWDPSTILVYSFIIPAVFTHPANLTLLIAVTLIIIYAKRTGRTTTILINVLRVPVLPLSQVQILS